MNGSVRVTASAIVLAITGLVFGPAAAQENVLWSNGAMTILVSPSGLDPHGRHIEVQRNGETLYRSPSGYLASSVRVLWQRGYPPAGPDVVVGGYTGGSHCCFDIMSLEVSREPQFQTVSFNDREELTIGDTEGIPHFVAPFVLTGFNAAQASIASVPFPVVWQNGHFDAELAKLVKRLPDESALKTSEAVIRDELGHWTIVSYPAPGHSAAAPKTVQVLLELILRGHSDVAKRLLYGNWPPQIAGREAYWRDLAKAVTNHLLWKQFVLDRIPNSDLLRSEVDPK